MPGTPGVPGTPGTQLKVGLLTWLVLSCLSALIVKASRMAVFGQDQLIAHFCLSIAPTTMSWSPTQETTCSPTITSAMVTIAVIRQVMTMSDQTGREMGGTGSAVRPVQRSLILLLKNTTVAQLHLAGCLEGTPLQKKGWSPGEFALWPVAMIVFGKQMLMFSIVTMPILCITL